MGCLIDLLVGNNTSKVRVTLTETDDATGATVVVNDIGPGELTVYEADGTTEVSGIVWPVALTYVAGSDGKYVATIPENTFTLADVGKFYRGKLSIDDGALRAGERYVDLHAVTPEA